MSHEYRHLMGVGVVLAVVLVVLVAAILVVLILTRKQRGSGTDLSPVIINELDAAIERFNQAVRHHVDVSAVLALAESLERKPELIRQLSEYSREVVAAALLYRVNSLGASLRHAQDYYATMQRQYRSHEVSYVRQARAAVDALLKELEGANAAVQAFNRLRTI